MSKKVETLEKVDVSEMKKMKGVPYEIKEDKIIIYPEGSDPIEGSLELGKSVYSTVQKMVREHVGGTSKAKQVGNFTYTNNSGLIVVTRLDGSVLFERKLEPEQMHNVKLSVMKMILAEVK